MEWLSPPLASILLFVVALSIVVGRARHEPARSIALNAAGQSLLLVGLLWAGSLGTPAVVAAGVASLGAILFTMASSQRRPSARSA